MKDLILIMIIMTMISSCLHDIDNKQISQEIIRLEKTALEQWNNGNPSGYLDIMDSNVVYFDDMTDLRLDGFDKIQKLYESVRGQIQNLFKIF